VTILLSQKQCRISEQALRRLYHIWTIRLVRNARHTLRYICAELVNQAVINTHTHTHTHVCTLLQKSTCTHLHTHAGTNIQIRYARIFVYEPLALHCVTKITCTIQ
jgi:hypothetical protein